MERLDQLVAELQINGSEIFMKRKLIKSKKVYKKVEFDIIKSKEAQSKIKRKMPTSISLSPEVVDELKEIAEKKGIPYQVLMRSFILEGLEKLKKAS
jgi:predicted DNA binding CopG/RHH family protein